MKAIKFFGLVFLCLCLGTLGLYAQTKNPKIKSQKIPVPPSTMGDLEIFPFEAHVRLHGAVPGEEYKKLNSGQLLEFEHPVNAPQSGVSLEKKFVLQRVFDFKLQVRNQGKSDSVVNVDILFNQKSVKIFNNLATVKPGETRTLELKFIGAQLPNDTINLLQIKVAAYEEKLKPTVSFEHNVLAGSIKILHPSSGGETKASIQDWLNAHPLATISQRTQKVKEEVNKAEKKLLAFKPGDGRDLATAGYTSESIPNLKLLVGGILAKLDSAELSAENPGLNKDLRKEFNQMFQIITGEEKNLKGQLGGMMALKKIADLVKRVEKKLEK